MTTSFDLTAVFTSVEEGWVQAQLVEIPGVITAAPTLDEAKELLADALREYLLAVGDAEATAGGTPTTGGHRVAVTLDL